MSISVIRAQNPQEVVYAGGDLATKASALDELVGEQVRALNQLKQDWSGSAANAAVAAAYRNIQHQHWQHEKLAALANAMKSGGGTLVAVRDVLLAWVDIASTLFDVSDAGVVTPRPPNDTAPWVAIAASYTKIIQQLIESFVTTDQTVSTGISAINAGWLPGNNPLPGNIDPDSLNSEQLKWMQSLAGSGDPDNGEGGVGVPNTDLSIMGMTPDGRLFTIQGDTGVGMGETGGPGLRPAEGGHNNIIFWRMDEHGKWVVDEVVNDPFPNTPGRLPKQAEDISTIPTSTFNNGDSMYTSVMNVKNWDDGTWQTRSSQLYKSTDGGRTWEPVKPLVWANSGAAHDNPFQVQSFAPSDDGYTYMYGTQDGRANDGMHVARVPTDQIENPAAYEYWNGSGFDADQYPATSPAILAPPSGYEGVGEPSVHFYDNRALVTFNDNMGNVFTSSSTDGVTWSPPQLVTAQPGAYGVFQSPLSGGDSIDASISLWKPYGTHLVQIQNSDTRGLGAY